MSKSSKVSSSLLFIVVFLGWYILGHTTNQLFLPSMESVFSILQKLWEAGKLQSSIKSSFIRITVATGLSFLISIPIGLLAVTFKYVDNLVLPITNAMRYLPITAFSPLLILWLGIGEPMKLTFLFIATFVYFLPTVIMTFKSIDVETLEVALTSGITRVKLMRYVYLPYCAPNLCKSFLMMYGIGWTYIVVAENVNTVDGLGHLILIGSARGNTAMVFAGLLTIVLISVLLDVIGNYILRKRFKWHFREE